MPAANAEKNRPYRDQLTAYLDELEEELDPPTPEDIAEAAAAFDRTATTPRMSP